MDKASNAFAALLQATGWRWMAVPVVALLVAPLIGLLESVLGWLVCTRAGYMVFGCIEPLECRVVRWLWTARMGIYSLYPGSGPAQAVALLALVGTCGLIGWLEARRQLAIVWPLLPALLFVALVLGSAGLEVLRCEDPAFRQLHQFLFRNFGIEGCTGLALGFVLAGAGLAAHLGSSSACEKCGAWWGELIAWEDRGGSSTSGGRFASDGSGWERTSKVKSVWDETRRCRKCDHQWTATFSSTSKYRSRGLFGGWERDR